ncbi:hypothetical protein HW561_21460 [Rhodobacteraceae bacterium B1Z28]|uniref:Uncharacterized protein n=1 Tax=Ruegeria haliotis TaxID=2747601 RepID=A0ABX2PVY8_9RHOB|nr:hypothetical protein [Ruegeria haliotis]NVO58358.1 hypothetical protein [Ruegeria haliotis]
MLVQAPNALRVAGVTGADAESLLATLSPPFEGPDTAPEFPLSDESFVETWDKYVSSPDIWLTLSTALPQLRFEISDMQGQNPAYLAATKRGDLSLAPNPADGLQLEAPEALSVTLHQTPAGRIPVLEPATRSDFEALLRAFLYRCEPVAVPRSMGAAMVSGFNNWDRIARLKAGWLASGNSEFDWTAHFKAEIVPNKSLYQDRFIILSRGTYSNVTADDLPGGQEKVLELSRVIRLEHECAHYFTRRVCGQMRNDLYDELMADYAGLVAATGQFDAELFLMMIGLTPDRALQPQARARIYLDQNLTPAAERGMLRLLAHAASVLDRLHRDHIVPRLGTSSDIGQVLLALSALCFEDFAAGDIEHRFIQSLDWARAT